MIEGMGIKWAGLFLGLVAFALVPLPVLFYLKGAKLRERSTFAPTFSAANTDHAPASPSDEEKEPVEEEKKQS
jgi:MFS transporter, DHA1 family, multidrug resistance protein